MLSKPCLQITHEAGLASGKVSMGYWPGPPIDYRKMQHWSMGRPETEGQTSRQRKQFVGTDVLAWGHCVQLLAG